MNEEEKIALIEETMELDEGELKIDSVLSDYEEWDSLSKLSLMALSKQKFNKTLTADTLRGFVTVKDICDWME